MKKITEITRRDIFDIIVNGFIYSEFVPKYHPDRLNYGELEEQKVNMFYWGRLDEIRFLKRLYKLDRMPSTDSRFENAEGDIWQHTVNNDDWECYWVFEDGRFNLSDGNDDKFLLEFLCEMFHPVVHNEEQPWQKYLDKFNELLKYDGYELFEKTHLSGRGIYGWREIHNGTEVVIGQIENIKEAFNTDYVRTQVALMYQMINTAPHSAIGKAKELLEICCKTILDEQNIEYSTELDLTQLMRAACECINLSPKKVPDGVAGKDIAGRILGNLANISQGMAELRNLYGDGHGKNRNFKSLPSRYANLAVGVSVAAVNFMWDTYQERISHK